MNATDYVQLYQNLVNNGYTGTMEEMMQQILGDQDLQSVEQNIGMVTAYAYAVSKGFVGTEDEFAELLANFADAAQRAEEAAADANIAKTDAEDAKTGAQRAASAAADSSTAAAISAALATSVVNLTDKDDENKLYAMAWSVENGFPVLTLTERT